jgi:excisionase family DNA binding protein
MSMLDPSTTANSTPAALMTLEQLAQYLGVTPRWVYDNHQKLGIPAFQIGRTLRFRPGDVDAWLDTRRTG